MPLPFHVFVSTMQCEHTLQRGHHYDYPFSHSHRLYGVSISNSAFCTLSQRAYLTDLLIWLTKWVDGKSFEVWKVCSLVESPW